MRLWPITLALLFITTAAGNAWAAPMDEEVRKLISDIMGGDFAKGRHQAALDNLEAAKLLCEDDGCSKAARAELDAAVAEVNKDRTAKEQVAKSDLPARVAVHVEGADAARVRQTIIATLPAGIEVVDAKSYSRALRRAGVLRAGSLLAAHLRKSLTYRLKKANSAAKVDAVVIAVGKGDQVRVLYLDERGVRADDTTSIDDDVLYDDVASLLEPMLSPEPALEAAPDPVSAQGEKPTPEAAAASGEDDGDTVDLPSDLTDRSRAMFIGSAGFEMGMRDFRYVASEHNSRNLRSYDVFPTLGFGVAAEVYPGANSEIVVLSDIGIVASFHGTPSVPASTAAGERFESSSWALDTGLRYRLRTGGGPLPTIGLSGQYGYLKFDFAPDGEGADAVVSELPKVSYHWLRAGLDARSQIDRFAVHLGAGYRGALATKGIYAKFSDPSSVGFDLDAGVGVGIVDGLEVGFAVEYLRVVHSFTPGTEDLYRASGSADELVRMRLGLSYAL